MTTQNAVNNNQAVAINTVTFTSSGVYSKPNNLLMAIVECCGGGGGSDGLGAPAANRCVVASAGGAGGYVQKEYQASDLGPTTVVTIGTGGTGGGIGPPTPGTAGGTTTFDVLTAGGGAKGGTGAYATGSTANGGAGGIATGGDVNLPGSRGANGQLFIGGGRGLQQLIPLSSPSKLGPGGIMGSDLSARAGGVYGGGASGHGRINPGFTGEQVGAAGAAGIVIITEFLRP